MHGGGKDFPLCAMHAPRPPICPPLPQLRMGRPGRRLVPGTGGVRGGLVWGGGGRKGLVPGMGAARFLLGAGWREMPSAGQALGARPAAGLGGLTGRGRGGSGCRRRRLDPGAEPG